MKFHWFHLMPYPDLPEDFKRRYHSVWVDLPAREIYDPVRGHQIYNDYLDELEFAEQAGFDGICVNEHHANAYGLMSSPNLMAAALARRTSKAKLVVLGNSVALYNPPVRVAEEFAMLDVLSGGRLVAGFPLGSAMDTAFCMGAVPSTLRDKYYESVALIMRAWKTRAPFTFNGKYTQLRYVNPWPQPIQNPHPPIWIPGGGSIETWDWCLEHDYLYCYLSYFGHLQGKKVMDGFWETVEKYGRDKNPYRAGFLQFVAVANSHEEAERLYAEPALYFFERCLHNALGFTNPPGYTSIATLKKGIIGQVAAAAQLAQLSLTWKDIVDRGYIIVGTPDEVVQRLDQVITDMNVGHLLMLAHFGNMSKETTMYNTEMLGKYVLPKLRPRFSEWEDLWWPKDTLTELQEPAPIGAARMRA